MKGNTSCKSSLLLPSKTRGDKTSHPPFAEGDEKWDSINIQDNLFDVLDQKKKE